MPIENELKFLLSDPDALEARISSQISGRTLDQGYLESSARVRAERLAEVDRYTFNWKMSTEDGVIEIEKDIDQDDFARLWRHCKKRLTKRRYTLDHDGVTWDIDFFLDGAGALIFAMAEAEMLEGMLEPPSVPEILEGRISFAVPRGDRNFTSHALTEEWRTINLARHYGVVSEAYRDTGA